MKRSLISICLLMCFNAIGQEAIKQDTETKLFDKKEVGTNAIIEADPRSVLRNEETILELENNILQKKIIKKEREMELKQKDNILQNVPAEYLKKPEEYFKKLEQQKLEERQKLLDELKPEPAKPVEFQIDLFTKISKEQETKARKAIPDTFEPIPVVLPKPTPENTQKLDTSVLKDDLVAMNKKLQEIKAEPVKSIQKEPVVEKTKKEPKKSSGVPETKLVSFFKFGKVLSASFYAFYSNNGKIERELFENIKLGEVVNINKVDYVLSGINSESITLKRNK